MSKVVSAFVYLIIFLLSVYFSCIDSNTRLAYPDKKAACLFSSILVVLLPAIMFGLRDYSVGSDTLSYQWSYFDYYRYVSISDLFEMEREPLFAIGTYILFRISDNYTITLLALSGLTLGIAYASIVRMRDSLSIPFAWFIYLAYFSLLSLDQSRQMLSLSIVMYAFSLLLHEQRKRSAVLIVVATLIHYASATAFLFLLLKKRETRLPFPLLIVIITITIIAALRIENIYSAIGHLVSGFDSKYSEYFGSGRHVLAGDSSGSGMGFLAMVLPNLISVLIAHKYLKTKHESVFVTGALIACPLRMLGYSSLFLARLAYLPSLLFIYSYSMAYRQCNDANQKIMAIFATTILMIACFVVQYWNPHEVLPYCLVF